MKQIIIILSILFSITVFSQPREYFFGQSQLDVTQEIVEAPDGNLFLIGSATEYRTRIWLQKIRPDGKLIWDKIYFSDDEESNENGFGLKVQEDGDLFIFGQRKANGLGNEHGALIMKIDSAGNEIWKRIIPEATAFYDLAKIQNGFLLTGYSGNDAVIVSLDSEGKFVGKTVHNVSRLEAGKKILPTPFPDSFLIIGKASSGDDREFNGFYVHMIRGDRSLVWAKRIDTTVDESYYLRDFPTGFHKSMGAYLDSDSTFWIASIESRDRNVDLYHFSLEGDLIEKRTFGNSKTSEIAMSLAPLQDGGFLITGTASRYSNEFGFALRIDKNLTEVWRKYYGKEGFINRLFSGIETKAGQIFLTGKSNRKGNEESDFDAWILKPESNGNTLPITIKGKIILDLNDNCLADPGEPGLPNWFVNTHLFEGNPILSDKNGCFEVHTELDSFSIFQLLNPYPEIYEICRNPIGAIHSLTQPKPEIFFLVKNKDVDCQVPRVKITQPDLVRCETSQFTISVFNQTSKKIVSNQLFVELDDDLLIKKASLPFEKNGAVLKFELDSISILKPVNIDLSVETACDIQIGAAHPIKAWILPNLCEDPINEPKFSVTGKCLNNETIFEFKNTGADASVNPIYEISGNEILLEKDLEINLKNAGSSEVLNLPADGRTWRIDLKPTSDAPLSETVSATLEGCGLQENGLYATGYSNVRPRAEKPGTTTISPPNSVGLNEAVLNDLIGVGSNGYFSEQAPFDFTAQIKNQLSENAHTVEFRIPFNEYLNTDPTSFKLLAYSGEATVRLIDEEYITVILEKLDLAPGESVGIRCSLAPPLYMINNPYFGIQILYEARFNNLIFHELERSSYIFRADLERTEKEPTKFPEGVMAFGNWASQTGSDMTTAPDGSVFLSGYTYDFGKNHKARLIKINSEGSAEFSEAYKFGKSHSRSYIEQVLPSEGGGCFISGFYIRDVLPQRMIYTFLAEVNAKGKLIWSKGIDTLGIGDGAILSNMAALPDGNILLTGRTGISPDRGYFYAKADRKGNVLQVKLTPPNSDFFVPQFPQVMADGSIVSIYSSGRTFFIEKVDSSFNRIFYKKITGSNFSYSIRGFTQTPDGSFLASTQWTKTTWPTPTEVEQKLIKFSQIGNKEFEKIFELPSGRTVSLAEIIPAPGGGFFCGGNVFNDAGFSELLLMKIDDDGEFLWSKSWTNENLQTYTFDVAMIGDNHVALFGNSDGDGVFGLDQWVFIKTDLEGNLIGTSDLKTVHDLEKSITIFPNPASQKATIILSPAPAKKVTWILYDLSGKRILEGSTQTGGFSINTSDFLSGMYILQFPSLDFPTRKILVGE